MKINNYENNNNYGDYNSNDDKQYNNGYNNDGIIKMIILVLIKMIRVIVLLKA